jgi:uncharacterized protein YdhG (YjbR/CyaY superfamily)
MPAMAEKKTAKAGTKRATGKASETFTAEEKAAMREAARERKARGRKADGESDVLGKIAEMPEEDRVIAEKLHALVKKSAPELAPKTWSGMPAYANGDGKVVCFFQSADKFKARYATIGFNDAAKLDEGAMWPTSFAVTKLNAADEKTIAALVKRAVS